MVKATQPNIVYRVLHTGSQPNVKKKKEEKKKQVWKLPVESSAFFLKTSQVMAFRNYVFLLLWCPEQDKFPHLHFLQKL